MTELTLIDKPLLLGPNDSSGECPSKSRWSNKNKQCCCGSNCCWDRCEWSKPPTNCLEGVQNSKWVFNTSLGYYQAFQNTGISLTFQICFSGFFYTRVLSFFFS